jgi:hypothetical protein
MSLPNIWPFVRQRARSTGAEPLGQKTRVAILSALAFLFFCGALVF